MKKIVMIILSILIITSLLSMTAYASVYLTNGGYRGQKPITNKDLNNMGIDTGLSFGEIVVFIVIIFAIIIWFIKKLV